MIIQRIEFAFLAALFVTGPLWAESETRDYGERPSQRGAGAPEYVEPQGDAPFLLPPVTPRPGEVASGQGAEPRFLLREVLFEGNDLFTDEALRAIAAPWLDQPVTRGDLETLRLTLTRHYEEAGYPNSGALLPGQHIHDGRVTYRIVEGRLSEVRVTGSGDLHPDYVGNRILMGLADRPLHTPALAERFQLLLTDPLIERLHGTLRPGGHPGESLLDLSVTRARPYSFALQLDNYRAPSTGAEAGRLIGSYRNLTGWGDALSLEVARSQGAWEGDIAWSIPINARDTRLGLSYSRVQSSVVEEPLHQVDIDSRANIWALNIDHPLRRSATERLGLSGGLERRDSQTWLLGRGEPLSLGVESDGRSNLSVLRLAQDYSLRSPDSSFAARSTFRIGLDAFNATRHEELPDGRFVSWVMQLQQAWRWETGGQLILRGDFQWANERLLPLEQFSVGGAASVRGYRENQLLRDQGYFVSAEYRHPIDLDSSEHLLHWVVFSDAGAAWNRGERNETSRLWSVGIGLRWDWGPLHLTADWGHALESVPKPFEVNLQDDGLHLGLRIDLR